MRNEPAKITLFPAIPNLFAYYFKTFFHTAYNNYIVRARV